MNHKVFGCCENKGVWIFLYENNEIYSICEEHFKSLAHRINVKKVVNIQTQQGYEPTEIFGGTKLEAMPGM